MKNRPNILFITSDQHRADSMGCYGHPCVRTPHLDQLAYSGVRFENAYADCPVCIPARTTIVTGIPAHRYGMPAYAEDYRIQRERSLFLGSLLTQGGYQTCLVGKTHWHTPERFRAGFESVVWETQLNYDRVRACGYAEDGAGMGFNEVFPALSYMPPSLNKTVWLMDKAIDFLETRDRDQPFFLWVSTNEPHPPFVIHEPFYSMYDQDQIPEPVFGDWCADDVCPRTHYIVKKEMKTEGMTPGHIRKMRGVYYGMITNIDHQIGKLLGTLQRNGDYENTLIVYTTDHGEFLGDHGAARKSSFCEAAARLPFIMKPPAWDPVPDEARVSSALVTHEDLLPTFCDYAGVDVPSDVQARSLRGILTGKETKTRDLLHGHIDDMHMLHDGRYKYIYNADDGSELLFDTSIDRFDRCALHDRSLLDMHRQQLYTHLREENHPHALEDGTLLNKHLPRPSLATALARECTGLGPIGRKY